MQRQDRWKQILLLILKLIISAAILYCSYLLGIALIFTLAIAGLPPVLIILGCLFMPALIPVLFVKQKLHYIKVYGIILLLYGLSCALWLHCFNHAVGGVI